MAHISDLSIEQQHNVRNRTVYLLNLKKYLIKEILILKSAFSIVDQMFMKEISNADFMKRNWFRLLFFKLNVEDPQKMNSFVSSVMDPFKDEERGDITYKQYTNVVENNNNLDKHEIKKFIFDNKDKSHEELLFENYERA